MANVVMFYEEKCKKKFENRKIQFLDPLVKIGPPRAKKGPKWLLKTILHVDILPLDDPDGF